MTAAERMSLTARYTGSSVRIEGTAAAIIDFAQRLCAGMSFRLGLQQSEDSGPYEGFLEKLVVKSGGGRLSVQRDGKVLVIEGAAEYLKNLGQESASVIDDVDLPAHTHIEYHPGHFYLRDDAQPLVIVATG